MPRQRSENSYISNDILPFLNSHYNYPIHDSERVFINDVPIYRPSGGRTSSTIDIVYYHNGEPLLLVEAKSKHKTHESALVEVLVYLRNFPKDKPEFSKSGKRPKYLATTVGTDIKFYKWSLDYEAEDFVAEPLDEIISFDTLLKLYGLSKGYIPTKLTSSNFKSDFFDELLDVFLPANRKITKAIVKRVSQLILIYLWDKTHYTVHEPYISQSLFKKKAILEIFNRYDLYGSLGTEVAQEYRKIILRAFQGGGFNQYLTEQCIIDFMVNLLGRASKNSKVLDFECGSGGFLASVVKKFNLPLNNIKGIDIDELPYITAKTYIALHFKLKSRSKINNIPIVQTNGLYNHGNNWDIVIGNPAGNKNYHLGNLKMILKDGLKKITSEKGNCSEYELSIQQAIRSVKAGGRICLILTESFFSNSSDDDLRKFVIENCKIKAIISLPRGIFKEGTSTKQKRHGSRKASMKMSILFAKKIKPIKLIIKGKTDLKKLSYPIFLSSVKKSEKKVSSICEWLKPELDLVLANWKLNVS